MSTAGRRVRLIAGDQAFDVAVPDAGPLTVQDAGEPVTVTRLDRATFEVAFGARRMTVHAVASGGRYWASAAGCTFAFGVAPAEAETPARGEADAREPLLAAPMPATVIALHAAPGSTVRRDDILVVLEAMKMELSIRSPRDGVVESVGCREGELVEPGVPLVTLRAESG